MDLRNILERVEPLEEYTPRSKFVEILNKYPELEESLISQLSLDINQEWVQKAEKERFFFLIYDDTWKKTSPHSYPNSIQLKFIGMQYIPTIAIDIHQKPV